MRSFLFDVQLVAAIRIDAADADDARRKLIDDFGECETANFGAFRDGTPITGEVSIDLDVLGFERVDLVEDDDHHQPQE